MSITIINKHLYRNAAASVDASGRARDGLQTGPFADELDSARIPGYTLCIGPYCLGSISH